MTLLLPLDAEDLSYPAYLDRLLMASLISPGVVDSGDFAVSPSSGLQVQIAAGKAFVQQSINSEESTFYNGLYFVCNDGAINPSNTITAPVSNPRWDQVALIVNDVPEQGGSGQTKPQVLWIPGNENAAASLTNVVGLGTLPPNSLGLANVLQAVGESTVGTIVSVAPRAGGTGNNAGSSIIPTSQSVTSTGLALLGTPDEVSGLVLPSDGLIEVLYQATWQESVAGAAQASICLNGIPIDISATGAGAGNALGPMVQSAFTGATSIAGTNYSLSSFAGGLMSVGDNNSNANQYVGDSATGQVIGGDAYSTYADVNYLTGGNRAHSFANVPAVGGPCYIFAPAGQYNVTVEFKSSSGSVTVSNRRLYAKVLSY